MHFTKLLNDRDCGIHTSSRVEWTDADYYSTVFYSHDYIHAITFPENCSQQALLSAWFHWTMETQPGLTSIPVVVSFLKSIPNSNAFEGIWIDILERHHKCCDCSPAFIWCQFNWLTATSIYVMCCHCEKHILKPNTAKLQFWSMMCLNRLKRNGNWLKEKKNRE